MAECKARTKNGARCAAYAGSDGYCFAHSKDLKAKRDAARKLGGQYRRRATNDAAFPNCDVKTALGLAAFVENVIKDAWTLERSHARSRTLGYLAQVQKGIVEAGELEARVSRIEGLLSENPQTTFGGNGHENEFAKTH